MALERNATDPCVRATLQVLRRSARSGFAIPLVNLIRLHKRRAADLGVGGETLGEQIRQISASYRIVCSIRPSEARRRPGGRRAD